MSKISIRNMNLHYGDFHALKNHSIYRTIRMREIYIIKVHQPYE